jgi:valyl-tRNA synthetase
LGEGVSCFDPEEQMALPKRYIPGEVEPRLLDFWLGQGVYHFNPARGVKVYSIDTPPPTVSGHLHLGHIYSYTHADLFARFWRMRGLAVFYPMGYDDNGLPTERLVERQTGFRAIEVGRKIFVEKCLELSQNAEDEYRLLWQRLGLSIDWRFTYRTIDQCSWKTSQQSFLDLYHKGLIYHQKAPTLWCPECQTAIAQADVDDLERTGDFYTLEFHLQNGKTLPIATTRPELLPACVAIFVHPQDGRFKGLVGQRATVPIFGQSVPVLEDSLAEPEKGSGAVMCCTFGDATDKEWWYTHRLPLVEVIGRDSRLTAAAGDFAGLGVADARRQIVAALNAQQLLLAQMPTSQVVPVHDRCETPIEYIMSHQWFIRLLEFKQELLEAGEKVRWHPQHMQARYRTWVENLAWDWCISRQRYFGICFPVWYCQNCGQAILASENQLPVDPTETQPSQPCTCGSTKFLPEEDVLDTWATSSMSPQIVGKWLCADPGENLYQQVFPFSLRPQGHEIIRTWAFYTIAKSYFHFGQIPWSDVALSGWGIAGEGMGKISKSRGGGPIAPLEMIERYSADAVRYWATSTSLGKDAVINEEKIKIGAKLINKLYNVSLFAERFLEGYRPPQEAAAIAHLPFTPADRWILSRSQRLINHVTALMEAYDYAAAKSEIEVFFWSALADNYLEMGKQRLYTPQHPAYSAARYALYRVLENTIKLFAPFLPYVSEMIYQGLFRAIEPITENPVLSVHNSTWPIEDPILEDDQAEADGEILVVIAVAARRYKSERNLPLNTELPKLLLSTSQTRLAPLLESAVSDLSSITRAREITIVDELSTAQTIILESDPVRVAIAF